MQDKSFWDDAKVVDTNDKSFWDDATVLDAPNNTVFDEANNRVVSLPQTLNADESEYLIKRDADQIKDFFGMQEVGGLESLGKGLGAFFAKQPSAAAVLVKEQAELTGNTKKSPYSYHSGTLGMLGNMSDILGSARDMTINYFGKDEVSAKMDSLIERNKKYVADAGLVRPEQGGLSGLLFDLGEGGGSLLTSLGISALTRSPTMAASYFGALQKSSIYEEARKKGLSPEEAGDISTIAGVTEGALEFVGLDRFIKAMKGTSIVKRFVSGFAIEAMQEGSQATAEELITQTSDVRTKEFTQTVQDILYQAAIGGVIGGSVNVALGKDAEDKAKQNGIDDATAKKIGEYVANNVGKLSNGNLAEFIDKELAPIAKDDKSAQEFITLMQKFGNNEELVKRESLTPDERALFDQYIEMFNKSGFDSLGVQDVEKTFYEQAIQAGEKEDVALAASKIVGARSDAASRALGITPMEWYKSQNLSIQDGRINKATKQNQSNTNYDLFNAARRKAKKPYVAKESAQTSLIYKEKKKKEKAGYTPIINYLSSIGGIDSTSRIAAELNSMGITNKTHPRLFKKGGMTSLDDLVPSEFDDALSDNLIVAVTDGDTIDQNWLLEQLRNESFGKGTATQAQAERDARSAQIDDLLNILGRADKDITTMTNAEVQQVIDDYMADNRDSQSKVEFFPEDEIPFFQSDNTLYQNAQSSLQSKLIEAVNNLKQAKGSGDQMLGILKNTAGVKEEEIAWTGLDEFLKGKQSVTKDEIAQYLEQNKVQIEEVTLGGKDNTFRFNSVDEYMAEIQKLERQKRFDEAEALTLEMEKFDLGGDTKSGETKFNQYTLPGGENYREVLLTLPRQTEQQVAQDRLGKDFKSLSPDEKAAVLEARRQDEYKSSHFDQPNILAHVRLNDRVDADGKKVLFVEEIQSDWHQAGRKKGYKSEEAAAQRQKDLEAWDAKTIELRDAADAARDRYIKAKDENPTDWSNVENIDDLPPMSDAEKVAYDAWQAELEKFRQHAAQRPADTQANAVPDAPFKKTWHEMAFRRVMQMAAEQGYDRVAWTTGEQQAERYDLSKQIDSIRAIRGIKDQYLVRAVKDGNKIFDKQVSEADLPDVVGKELADKIRNEAKPGGDAVEYSGLDLKVGGEGMKGFYDKILPNYANKFGKKFGAKVGETTVSHDLDLYDSRRGKVHPSVHSIDITPQMREAATSFELFQDKARGSITFKDNGEKIITLFAGKNESTLIHELAHLFLRDMRDVAKSTNRPRVKADYKAIEKWLGVKGDTFTVAQEEKFARGFELYMREGKAPKPELQGAFDRFKRWLTSIYKSAKRLNVNISPEVRTAFDRMLGGDFVQAEKLNQGQSSDKIEADYDLIANMPTPSTLKEDTKSIFRSVGDWSADAFVPVSTRLGNIDQGIKHAVRKFMFNTGLHTHEDNLLVKPFIEKVSDNMSEEDYRILDFALKNRDAAKVDSLMDKYGLQTEWAKVRDILDKLYNEALSVGLDINYIEDYFPRKVKRGMANEYIAAMQGREDWSEIESAMREIDPNGVFSPEEQAEFVNKYLRGFSSSRINMAKPSYTKERTVDYVEPQFNKFYNDSMPTLIDYIASVRHGIELRKLFGKSEKETDKNIGAYVLGLIKQGIIKPEQEMDLKKILKVVAEPTGTHGWISWAKNASYVYLMGSPISAITQIQDLAFSLHKNGYYRTIKSLTKSLTGNQILKKEDIGINNILREFEDETRANIAVRKVFKIVGLEFMDNVGKETYIGASYDRLVSTAKKGGQAFDSQMTAIFGKDAAQVKKDLISGNITENVKYLLFSELSDVQPISLAEMPVHYLKGGNGRVFYMLKTYTVKQLDTYRREVFTKIASGEPPQMAEGMASLIKLAISLMLMGMSSDAIKDLLLGRDIEIDDLVSDNILKLAGFTKYQIYKAKEEGIANAALRTLFMPPIGAPVDDLFKDIKNIVGGEKDISDSEVLGKTPIVGKFYYWWWGGGRSKLEKKAKVSTP